MVRKNYQMGLLSRSEVLSLEDVSVLTLTQVSDTCPESPVDVLASRRIQSRPKSKSRRQSKFVQPCLRLRRVTPLTNSPFTNTLPGFQSFKPLARNSYKCHCLFTGGAGFKSMSKTVPCESKLCVNRLKPKWCQAIVPFPLPRPPVKSHAPLPPQEWLQHRLPKSRISLKISHLLKPRAGRLIEVRLDHPLRKQSIW